MADRLYTLVCERNSRPGAPRCDEHHIPGDKLVHGGAIFCPSCGASWPEQVHLRMPEGSGAALEVPPMKVPYTAPSQAPDPSPPPARRSARAAARDAQGMLL